MGDRAPSPRRGMGTDNTSNQDELLEIGDLVEVSGAIKWFDVAKGYGFINPDDGLTGDILLHVTCLRRDGHQTALEGARVVCLVKQGDRGMQAFKVLSMDSSTAVHPAELQEQRTHVAVVPESGLERALVKWFNRTKGFGFLTRGDGTEDIFIHMETPAALRPDRAASWPGRAGALRARRQGPHGGRNPSRYRGRCLSSTERLSLIGRGLFRASAPGAPVFGTGRQRMRRKASIRSSIRVALTLVATLGACADALAQSQPMILPTDPAPLVASTANGTTNFTIEVADDEAERTAGLMNRQSMPDDHGMLFVFKRTQPVGFWMKDTPLALDLIFVDQAGTVVDVEPGKPFSESLIAPPKPVRYVLEVKSGVAEKAGILPGTELEHPIFDHPPGADPSDDATDD